MRDLVLLVADKNMEFAVRGALQRPGSLGIRPITFEIRTHPNRDGGVRSTGPQQLGLERRGFRHAVMMLDHEGSGSGIDAGALENQLDGQLSPCWGHDAKAIVIDPELEQWIWGSDAAMAQVLEWTDAKPIRVWLAGVDPPQRVGNNEKPIRPKEAFERVLAHLKTPRSSAIYEALTARISLQRCTDSAFMRLRGTLQDWFPRGGAEK